jgi:acyl-CoA synthetase (AMP-forming)/AMP-acid ligase II
MPPPRTQLYAGSSGIFLHNLILGACRRNGAKTAIIDTSEVGRAGFVRITYAEYGEILERLARGLVGVGVRPGDVIAIYLPNSWEFCAIYHAATMAGAIPTPLNPSYREREVRYQLENSGASLLISDGPLIENLDLSGLPELRRVYLTREPLAAALDSRPFRDLLRVIHSPLPEPEPPEETIAVLPYSSGTTGMPKGVMLSHTNLVTNIFQLIPAAGFPPHDVTLCFLPLYHIYGLNVVLNPMLAVGATLVLMPRFDLERALDLIAREAISYIPMVPPILNVFCQAAQQGKFPANHRIRAIKSGAAPLPPDLPRRFTELTGIRLAQGYGMTEASPVTHIGFLEDPYYCPESIGGPVALTDCRILGEDESELPPDQPGELVMRGPQFMMGYWKSPEDTAAVLRDGWYWSGDVARVDKNGFYWIVDRRKEMIKYKGFAVAPAEVEAVLMEHPAVLDCGVVGRPDQAAGEVPCAFVVLRDGTSAQPSESELTGYVAERLTGYKQPREVRFVSAIPRTPSGKILRRELRKLL